jgi:hypothetical protein
VRPSGDIIEHPTTKRPPRGTAGADRRDAGVARLSETVQVHLRGVSDLFVAQLDDQELAALKPISPTYLSLPGKRAPSAAKDRPRRHRL